jgi:hypothetical protein
LSLVSFEILSKYFSQSDSTLVTSSRALGVPWTRPPSQSTSPSNKKFSCRQFFGPATSPPPQPSIFLMILFLSTTLSTEMTGISLHMQWLLTSQSHGSFSQREQLFFSLWIKLYALIRAGVSLLSFDTGT